MIATEVVPVGKVSTNKKPTKQKPNPVKTVKKRKYDEKPESKVFDTSNQKVDGNATSVAVLLLADLDRVKVKSENVANAIVIAKVEPRTRKDKKPVRTLSQLTLRELYLFNYYKEILRREPHIADLLFGIDLHRKPISNRCLEHFATKYSRKYDIRLDDNGDEDSPYGDWYVADKYYNHLPKTDSDPCCRGDLVEYAHKGQILRTTIPQLGSNISICRSPGIKYAAKMRLSIRKDLNNDKEIKNIKPTPEIELPRKKLRSPHHLIPLSYHLSF